LLFAIVQTYASLARLYEKYPSVDMLTHFLGGLALGALVKDFVLAVSIILIWEALEIVLIKPGKPTYRETLENKIRDGIITLVGWAIVAVL